MSSDSDDDATRIRAEIVEKVLGAIIAADEHDDSRCDDAVGYHEMAEAAVDAVGDYFAAAIAEEAAAIRD